MDNSATPYLAAIVHGKRFDTDKQRQPKTSLPVVYIVLFYVKGPRFAYHASATSQSNARLMIIAAYRIFKRALCVRTRLDSA